MYSSTETPSQIGANLLFGGAVLSMLVADLPSAAGDTDHAENVVLSPAIPRSLGVSRLEGLKLSDDRVTDFEWNENVVVEMGKISGQLEGLTFISGLKVRKLVSSRYSNDTCPDLLCGGSTMVIPGIPRRCQRPLQV
jgi:hypothetical protein